MFSASEKDNDEIYAWFGKDYSKETEKAHRIIRKYKRTKGNRLLDVACGTGVHAGFLNKHYRVEGLDLDSKMLSIARTKHPKIRFHQGDMTSFVLGRKFEVVTCLFSSIGYVKTKSNLRKAIKAMSSHIQPGGVLLVEPWFSSKQWTIGHNHMITVNRPGLKITRISRSARKGNISIL